MNKTEVESLLNDDDVNFYGFELSDFNAKSATITILEMMDFTLNLVGDGLFHVQTEEDLLKEDWLADVNQYCKEKRTVTQVLEKCMEAYGTHVDNEESEEDEDGDIVLDPAMLKEDDVFVNSPTEAKGQFDFSTEQYDSVDKKFNLKKKSNKRNAQAIACLTKDYLMLQTSDSQKLGFIANPIGDDFLHWEAKFFGYTTDTPLGKDMQQYQKTTGKDHILLDIKFPEEYPLKPPFIRVIRPRFQFRTAHVTIGGSICTEMLTPKGWLCSTSVEAILIQIRMQMVMGNGRLDFTKTQDYTEQEAMDAFNRVARDHNWI